MVNPDNSHAIEANSQTKNDGHHRCSVCGRIDKAAKAKGYGDVPQNPAHRSIFERSLSDKNAQMDDDLDGIEAAARATAAVEFEDWDYAEEE